MRFNLADWSKWLISYCLAQGDFPSPGPCNYRLFLYKFWWAGAIVLSQIWSPCDERHFWRRQLFKVTCIKDLGFLTTFTAQRIDNFVESNDTHSKLGVKVKMIGLVQLKPISVTCSYLRINLGGRGTCVHFITNEIPEDRQVVLSLTTHLTCRARNKILNF